MRAAGIRRVHVVSPGVGSPPGVVPGLVVRYGGRHDVVPVEGQHGRHIGAGGKSRGMDRRVEREHAAAPGRAPEVAGGGPSGHHHGVGLGIRLQLHAVDQAGPVAHSGRRGQRAGPAAAHGPIGVINGIGGRVGAGDNGLAAFPFPGSVYGAGLVGEVAHGSVAGGLVGPGVGIAVPHIGVPVVARIHVGGDDVIGVGVRGQAYPLRLPQRVGLEGEIRRSHRRPDGTVPAGSLRAPVGPAPVDHDRVPGLAFPGHVEILLGYGAGAGDYLRTVDPRGGTPAYGIDLVGGGLEESRHKFVGSGLRDQPHPDGGGGAAGGDGLRPAPGTAVVNIIFERAGYGRVVKHQGAAGILLVGDVEPAVSGVRGADIRGCAPLVGPLPRKAVIALDLQDAVGGQDTGDFFVAQRGSAHYNVPYHEARAAAGGRSVLGVAEIRRRPGLYRGHVGGADGVHHVAAGAPAYLRPGPGAVGERRSIVGLVHGLHRPVIGSAGLQPVDALRLGHAGVLRHPGLAVDVCPVPEHAGGYGLVRSVADLVSRGRAYGQPVIAHGLPGKRHLSVEAALLGRKRGNGPGGRDVRPGNCRSGIGNIGNIAGPVHGFYRDIIEDIGFKAVDVIAFRGTGRYRLPGLRISFRRVEVAAADIDVRGELDDIAADGGPAVVGRGPGKRYRALRSGNSGQRAYRGRRHGIFAHVEHVGQHGRGAAHIVGPQGEVAGPARQQVPLRLRQRPFFGIGGGVDPGHRVGPVEQQRPGLAGAGHGLKLEFGRQGLVVGEVHVVGAGIGVAPGIVARLVGRYNGPGSVFLYEEGVGQRRGVADRVDGPHRHVINAFLHGVEDRGRQAPVGRIARAGERRDLRPVGQDGARLAGAGRDLDLEGTEPGQEVLEIHVVAAGVAGAPGFVAGLDIGYGGPRGILAHVEGVGQGGSGARRVRHPHRHVIGSRLQQRENARAQSPVAGVGIEARRERGNIRPGGKLRSGLAGGRPDIVLRPGKFRTARVGEMHAVGPGVGGAPDIVAGLAVRQYGRHGVFQDVEGVGAYGHIAGQVIGARRDIGRGAGIQRGEIHTPGISV